MRELLVIDLRAAEENWHKCELHASHIEPSALQFTPYCWKSPYMAACKERLEFCRLRLYIWDLDH